MLEKILRTIEKFVPKKLYTWAQPIYHYKMALFGAVLYRFPSRKIKVVAVTGTKGKSSVTEILSAILEEAGLKTAVSNTIRFKIGDKSEDNLHKMSMPGRFFMQRFLRGAADAKCKYAIIETTSQGAMFLRHKFIDFDALIFTNLTPEHIEAHGSYEKYVAAKLSIAEALSKSKKEKTTLVVNGDNKESAKFLEKDMKEKYVYTLYDARPYDLLDEEIDFTFRGTRIHSKLRGEFNLHNILAAATYAEAEGIKIDTIKTAVEKFDSIRGRVEEIKCGQGFDVIVDYAHTPDSLQKLYNAFKNRRKICVLGNTGGGRDVWKRDEMARIAEQECDEIILTNEDPYDDDPVKIVEDMAAAITKKTPRIIMDRREAIRKALELAKAETSNNSRIVTERSRLHGNHLAVLITGKGTDPFIMGQNGAKIPWSDTGVVKEELEKLLS